MNKYYLAGALFVFIMILCCICCACAYPFYVAAYIDDAAKDNQTFNTQAEIAIEDYFENTCDLKNTIIVIQDDAISRDDFTYTFDRAPYYFIRFTVKDGERVESGGITLVANNLDSSNPNFTAYAYINAEKIEQEVYKTDNSQYCPFD